MTILNLSETEYRGLECESFSSIKYLLTSVSEYKFQKENKFQGNASTLLGTAIHHTLQGNSHLVAFQPLPAIKKNLEALAEFEKEFRAKVGEEGIIVPKAFEAKLARLVENFRAHPLALGMLRPCAVEKAYIFEWGGVNFKGKIDAFRDDTVNPYEVEIKSSSMAKTVDDFRDEAYERHYDLQAAMYRIAIMQNELCSTPKKFFLVANTSEPFKISVYRCSEAFMESGLKKLHKIVGLYKKHILNGEPESSTGEDGIL